MRYRPSQYACPSAVYDLEIGVLALQGDVLEHIRALETASKGISADCTISEVRTIQELDGLNGLVIPGGESTTLYKLCQREGMLEQIAKIPNIFGTCAGAILISKNPRNIENGQVTLGLMDIVTTRNAYGPQSDSFESEIDTALGKIRCVFIRAPKIVETGPGINVLAKHGSDIIACEEGKGGNYYLAACFHPELKTALFHGYFLRRIAERIL